MRKNRQTAKYHIKSYIIAGSLAGAISMALVLPVPVMAAQQSLAFNGNIYTDHLAHNLGRTANHIPVDVLTIREHHLAQGIHQLVALYQIGAVLLHGLQKLGLHRDRHVHGLLTGAGHTVVVGTVIDGQHRHTVQVIIVIADDLLAVALANAEARFDLNDTERDIIATHMWPLPLHRFYRCNYFYSSAEVYHFL